MARCRHVLRTDRSLPATRSCRPPWRAASPCPPLAAAVSEAGGLGFLAAGYKTADGMYQEIKQLRGPHRPAPSASTSSCRSRSTPTPPPSRCTRHQLAGEATWYETELGDPDSGTRRRLRRQARHPARQPGAGRLVPPSAARARDVLESLAPGRHLHPRHRHHRRGGPGRAAGRAPTPCRAGRRGRRPPGHPPRRPRRPTAPASACSPWSPRSARPWRSRSSPPAASCAAARSPPCSPRARARPSSARRSSPAPSPARTPLHKQALTNPLFVRTELTRAFSGRPARGLVNRFMREHGPYAPAAYPRGPPPDLAAAQGGRQGGRRAGHGAVGRAGAPDGPRAARRAAGRGAGGRTRPPRSEQRLVARRGADDRARVRRRPASTRAARQFVLDGPEGRHAVSVKRLRAGRGRRPHRRAGRWADGVVQAAEGKDRLVVRTCRASREEPAPSPRITVVQALPKGDRGELAVETMTETGVDAIVPWAASRCITQWKGDRGAEGPRQVAGHRPRGGQAVPPGALPRGRGRGDEQAGCGASGRSRLRRRPARGAATETLATAELPADRARSCSSSAPKAGVSPEELALFARGGREAVPARAAACCAPRPPGRRPTALLLGRTGRWS